MHIFVLGRHRGNCEELGRGNIIAEREGQAFRTEKRNKHVSRKADQIQKQCSLSSVASMAIEGDRKTIGLAPNKGLSIHEGNLNWLL